VRDVKSADGATSLDRSVELILRIEKRYQDRIRSDSRASFLTEGLLGKRYVNITRGFHGDVIPPDGEVTAIPERVGNQTDILDGLIKVLSQLKTSSGPRDKNQSR